jgi:hypothetical protein
VQVRPLLLHHQPQLPEPLQHPLPGLVAVQPAELFGNLVAQGGVGVQDVAARKSRPFRDLEVGSIVGRRDLYRAGAELAIDGLVGHDREVPAVEGMAHAPPDERTIPIVSRMHGHAGISEHRLDPRGCNVDVARAVREHVPERHQLALDVFVLDLGIRERGPVGRTPVDDPLSPIDQPFLVHPNEGHPHGPGELLVHGESQPVPVERVAEGLHLIEDPPAVLVLPAPHTLDELLPAEFPRVDPLAAKLALHHDLGPDPRVVGPRKPQGLESLHPAAPDHHVLEGLLERVADVKSSRDVGRWQDDAEGFPI